MRSEMRPGLVGIGGPRKGRSAVRLALMGIAGVGALFFVAREIPSVMRELKILSM